MSWNRVNIPITVKFTVIIDEGVQMMDVTYESNFLKRIRFFFHVWNSHTRQMHIIRINSKDSFFFHSNNFFFILRFYINKNVLLRRLNWETKKEETFSFFLSFIFMYKVLACIIFQLMIPDTNS